MSLNIDRSPGGSPARPRRGRRSRLGNRGSMGVMCAVMIPVLVGFGSLALNQGYYSYRAMLLRQTVQSAALAAAK